MNRTIRTLLCALMIAALLAGGVAATAECAHTNKKQVTVTQPPVYTSEAAFGHRKTVDTMIYWECTACGERFSGVPGESTTTVEPHTLVNNKCDICGYVIADQALSKVKSNGTITMNVGEQRQLQPVFASSQGWVVSGYKTNKAKVATVTATGLVTAIAEGKAKITVTCTNKKKATLTVKVVDPYKAKGVSIAQGKKATLSMGQTLQLVAQLNPITARTTLTWTSNKPKVATVSATGLVTPVSEGKAKITVRTANRKKATITIKVVDPYKPVGIALNQSGVVTLLMGQTLPLAAILSPDTARTTLTWTSSKTRVATVDANGLVTPVAEGTAKITVRTANRKKATVKVKVVDPYKATGVSFAQGSTVTVKVGATLPLTAVLAPATARTTLTWSSRKPGIAAVDANGVVTGVTVGTTKVTVRTANGKKATVKVVVTP